MTSPCCTQNHEVPEVDHLRHLRGDVFSDDGLVEALGDEASTSPLPIRRLR